MKIDKFTRLITALDFGAQQKIDSTNSKSEELSNQAQKPNNIQNSEAVRVSSSFELDKADKLARIKEQVRAGNYQVKSDDLARSFIEEIFS